MATPLVWKWTKRPEINVLNGAENMILYDIALFAIIQATPKCQSGAERPGTMSKTQTLDSSSPVWCKTIFCISELALLRPLNKHHDEKLPLDKCLWKARTCSKAHNVTSQSKQAVDHCASQQSLRFYLNRSKDFANASQFFVQDFHRSRHANVQPNMQCSQTGVH